MYIGEYILQEFQHLKFKRSHSVFPNCFNLLLHDFRIEDFGRVQTSASVVANPEPDGPSPRRLLPQRSGYLTMIVVPPCYRSHQLEEKK